MFSRKMYVHVFELQVCVRFFDVVRDFQAQFFFARVKTQTAINYFLLIISARFVVVLPYRHQRHSQDQ